MPVSNDKINVQMHSGAGTGGARGARASPDFCPGWRTYVLAPPPPSLATLYRAQHMRYTPHPLPLCCRRPRSCTSQVDAGHCIVYYVLCNGTLRPPCQYIIVPAPLQMHQTGYYISDVLIPLLTLLVNGSVAISGFVAAACFVCMVTDCIS